MAVPIPVPRIRHRLDAQLASGDSLTVRDFSIREAFSTLFEVNLEVSSNNADIDFGKVLGQPASFGITHQHEFGIGRGWQGICTHIEQVGVLEPDAQNPKARSIYQLTIVPFMWLLTQRRNYRIFQGESEPKIVLKILAEWGIEPRMEIDMGSYKDRKYRVQYGETDYAFISRLLEDAAITFYFEAADDETVLVLSDAPEEHAPRAVLPYVNHPSGILYSDYATEVIVTKVTRPGVYTQRDIDYRKESTFPLVSSAQGGDQTERGLERFHYNPGSALWRTSGGGDTPHADDKGVFRTDPAEVQKQVQKRLEAKQGAARMVMFKTTAFDLRPGQTVNIDRHPRSDLAVDKKLLIVSSTYQGDYTGEWSHHVQARFADMPYRPPLMTPKPKTQGVESAVVVGPAGQEIHTDEFGRVRVHFYWDRESKMNEDSSCWVPVSQPWAGVGYGGVNIPRIGQEVIVDFLAGDPDRPVITGRVFTQTKNVPYSLPANKTQSGWRSNTSPSNGGYNELMFEDKKDSELVRFQAQKDFSGWTKNNSFLNIDNDSTSQVGHDQLHSVMNDQTTKVKNDRKIKVENIQSHLVTSHILQQGNAETNLLTKDQFFVAATDGPIILRCGDQSLIRIEKDKIIIQAPEVQINPGQVETGKPTQPDDIEGAVDQQGLFFGAP